MRPDSLLILDAGDIAQAGRTLDDRWPVAATEHFPPETLDAAARLIELGLFRAAEFARDLRRRARLARETPTAATEEP